MMISVYFDPHWALPHGNVFTRTNKASQLRLARVEDLRLAVCNSLVRRRDGRLLSRHLSIRHLHLPLAALGLHLSLGHRLPHGIPRLRRLDVRRIKHSKLHAAAAPNGARRTRTEGAWLVSYCRHSGGNGLPQGPRTCTCKSTTPVQNRGLAR